MEPLNKKEFGISAAVGVFLGVVIGIMMSMSMAREYKKCEILKRENRLLRDMVMFYQEQQVNENIDSTFVCGE